MSDVLSGDREFSGEFSGEKEGRKLYYQALQLINPPFGELSSYLAQVGSVYSDQG